MSNSTYYLFLQTLFYVAETSNQTPLLVSRTNHILFPSLYNASNPRIKNNNWQLNPDSGVLRFARSSLFILITWYLMFKLTYVLYFWDHIQNLYFLCYPFIHLFIFNLLPETRVIIFFLLRIGLVQNPSVSCQFLVISLLNYNGI